MIPAVGVLGDLQVEVIIDRVQRDSVHLIGTRTATERVHIGPGCGGQQRHA